MKLGKRESQEAISPSPTGDSWEETKPFNFFTFSLFYLIIYNNV